MSSRTFNALLSMMTDVLVELVYVVQFSGYSQGVARGLKCLDQTPRRQEILGFSLPQELLAAPVKLGH